MNMLYVENYRWTIAKTTSHLFRIRKSRILCTRVLIWELSQYRDDQGKCVCFIKCIFTWFFGRNNNETLPSPKIMQISSTVCCLSCSFLLPSPIHEYIESEVNGKEILKLLTNLKTDRFWKSVKKSEIIAKRFK